MRCRVCHSLRVEDLGFAQGIGKCMDCGSYSRAYAVKLDFYEKNDYWFKGDKERLKLLQRSYFEMFVDKMYGGKSIEFGAADGDFIFLVQKHIHYDAVYSEVVDMLRDENNNKTFMKKHISPFGEGEGPFGSLFYNVFMINTIEHLDWNLTDIFNYVASITMNQGRFFVATNDGDALNAHDGMFRSREHNFIVTRKGFEKVCCTTGFDIIQYFKTPYDWVFAVFEKRRRG